LSQIEADINGTTGLGSSGAVTATDDGSGHLVLTSNEATQAFTIDANAGSAALGLTTDASTNSTVSGTSATRTTLQSTYNGLLTQINQLASDSGYNGVNLLNGDNLTINFNSTGSSSLTIQGVSFNSAGLGLSDISGSGATSFQSDSTLANLVTNINSAISTVQAQTETFGTNSSTISTRQSFETDMINTLQTGASNLVAADQNQESANLLTEQTQQQLEISALSIANQANQSVLKLFS
jgi:flagellin-like hook-associated protein FlgL